MNTVTSSVAVAGLVLGLCLGCNAITGVAPPEHLPPPVPLGPAAPALPSLAAAGNLQLWLTADEGLICDQGTGRVRSWSDQSGHGRDTSTAFEQLPPRCGGHELGAVDVPYFDAPTPSNGMFVDGTLDVDLSFLRATDYTIFVVERRWADRTGEASCMVLGTTLPDEAATCPATYYQALQVGYVYYDGFPTIDSDLTCVGCRANIAAVPAAPPAPAAFEMVRFSSDAGLQLWVNGEQHAIGEGARLVAASGGAIGRALWVSQGESRYLGDIAEIVAFDTALGPADQAAMESYLKEHWAQPFVPP